MKRPLAPWGVALELLRKGKKLTQEDLIHQRITTSGEYYRICRSKTGPSVLILNSLIKGMGYNWHDWATVIEEAFSRKPPIKQISEMSENRKAKKNLKAISNGQ